MRYSIYNKFAVECCIYFKVLNGFEHFSGKVMNGTRKVLFNNISNEMMKSKSGLNLGEMFRQLVCFLFMLGLHTQIRSITFASMLRKHTCSRKLYIILMYR